MTTDISSTSTNSSSSKNFSLLAQRLNQQGAYCLETGRYDKAISNFVKAMEYSKQEDTAFRRRNNKNNNKACCQCQDCTVEACIKYSHGLVVNQRQQQEQEEEDDDNNEWNNLPFNNNNKIDSEYNDNAYGYDDTMMEGGGYYRLYRQPIFISPNSFGHSMGLALPKIITFNLALAHHFKATTTMTNNNNINDYCIVIKLYQLIYKNEIQQKDGSIFMALVAANNLVGIYQRILFLQALEEIEEEGRRNKGQQQKQKKRQDHYLQFIISTVMIFVQDSRTVSSYSSSTSSSYCKIKEHCKMELNGFLQNAVSLIAKQQQQHCAGAA